MNKINIAIDGYSSCGKGTLAKALAKDLGYRFIDSGAMYRAVTLFAQQCGANTDDAGSIEPLLPEVNIDFEVNSETGRSEVMLNGRNVEKEIRNMEVAAAVSQVAKIPAVRRFLVSMQQKMGENKGVVMDGRDIGTVVFPGAELKIFMTARPEIRARRRFDELESTGVKTTYDSVLENILQRDKIDTSREDSPLTMTEDYKVLDNSDLSRAEQFELARGWVSEVLG